MSGKIKIVLILAVLAASGCGTKHHFKLSDGEVVDCNYEDAACGMTLEHCDVGGPYFCVTNAEKLD